MEMAVCPAFCHICFCKKKANATSDSTHGPNDFFSLSLLLPLSIIASGAQKTAAVVIEHEIKQISGTVNFEHKVRVNFFFIIYK